MIGELRKTDSREEPPRTVCVMRKEEYFVVNSLERQYLISRNSENVKQTRDDDFVIFHDEEENLRLKVSIDVGIPIESKEQQHEIVLPFNPQAIAMYLLQQ